ncbi:MAG: carboxypeptidase regulatory-like domain-containing protein [Terracidiphilus sp.]
MWFRIRTLTLLLFVAVCFEEAPAQVNSSGSIAGQVADSTGALVPMASVIAIQPLTNVQWKTVTDSAGSYIFPNLPVGTYTLSAQKEGFSKAQINSVILNAGDQLRDNFTLKPGTATETVEVSSDAINVDTESGNVGEVVGSQKIEAMPLVTRNFTQLVSLVPGVSSDMGSQNGFGSNSNLAASVNGVRENANNWTIDGVPNLDVYNGNNAIIPNVDAIAEFRIDRGNYTAEQGRSAGASINAIVKQGTNKFHGTAFEFMRNGALNANDYFANLYGTPRPNEHYNNWGYTVGGPIKKDKLFFFWSEEWRRIIEPAGTFATLVPTDQELGGDFSDYATMGLPEPMVTVALAANPLCVGCVAGQPFPGGTVNGVTRTQDVIPSGLLDANSLLLLKTYYPRAQLAAPVNSANFSSALPTTTTVREELIRMDYNLSDKWKVFAHYIQDQNHVGSPYSLWNDNSLPNVEGTHEFEPMQSFGLNLNGTLTPNLINEVEFGIYHDIIRITEDPSISRANAPGLNIPYYFPAPHLNLDDRIPQMHFAHYANINTDWPFLNGFFYNKWTDNLSWHKGAHNYKFGLLVTHQGKNENNQDSLGNGSFSWWGSQTGNDLADMLTNYADQYSEAESNPMQHLRYWDVEAYAQDQWQVTHRLSLTYGLRYTDFTPEIDSNNLLTNFLPQLYQSSLAPTVSSDDGSLSNIPDSQLSDGAYLPNNGIIVAGANSPYGDAIFKAPKLNLAPRVGFSYDVFGSGKTALRGGYGMYYDRTAPYELGGKSNPPFNAVVTLNSVTVDDPGHSHGSSSSYSPLSLTALNPKYTNPSNQQWSLGIQQELHRNTVLTLDYVRTQGTHLLYVTQLNQNGSQLEVAEGTLNPAAARPYLGYGPIAQFTPEASSTYNGMQLSLKEQLSSTLTLDANYTYSKVLTDAAGDANSPQDSHNLRADRGVPSFDRTHMIKANWVWKLPSFSSNAVAHQIVGGWQWAGLLSVLSGEPIEVTLFTSAAYSNDGVVDSTQRPNLVGKAQDGKGLHDWLNYNAFSVPNLGTFGNAGVSVARLPRETQVDSSISKDFRIYEQLHMQFNLSAINALNHTLFNGVDSSYWVGNPTFGHITSSTTPRVVQAGLHFSF